MGLLTELQPPPRPADVDALAVQVAGQGVEPAGDLDMQVPGDLRGREDRHVGGRRRSGQQQRCHGGSEVLRWALCGGAVHPQPGGVPALPDDPALGVGEVDKLLPAKEPPRGAAPAAPQ